jgi:hypothetical protein
MPAPVKESKMPSHMPVHIPRIYGHHVGRVGEHHRYLSGGRDGDDEVVCERIYLEKNRRPYSGLFGRQRQLALALASFVHSVTPTVWPPLERHAPTIGGVGTD